MGLLTNRRIYFQTGIHCKYQIKYTKNYMHPLFYCKNLTKSTGAHNNIVLYKNMKIIEEIVNQSSGHIRMHEW